MGNLIEIINLFPILERHGIEPPTSDFETFHSNISADAKFASAVAEIEEEIEWYFRQLKLPDQLNLYDKLILYLREKDIIATFNWDPFLAQAYQRNTLAVGYGQMPQLVFLHGNLAIGLRRNCQTYGWRNNSCDKCGDRFSQTPLLYPIEKKDYSKDGFIHEQWEIPRAHLRCAYFFTIFGYSAPASDVEARKLTHEVWKKKIPRPISLKSL